MVVKVLNDEYFPADLILLRTSETKGLCYVETKNLDGETNLKHKVAEKYVKKIIHKRFDQIGHKLQGSLLCEESNDQIYKFEGTLFLNYN
jgi:magnesium-transporting ATPase (P-type)